MEPSSGVGWFRATFGFIESSSGAALPSVPSPIALATPSGNPLSNLRSFMAYGHIPLGEQAINLGDRNTHAASNFVISQAPSQKPCPRSCLAPADHFRKLRHI